MSILERIFPTTEQLVLVPSAMEMTILPRLRTIMLFVAGSITDASPYEDLAKQFLKKGYSLHIFELPVPKV